MHVVSELRGNLERSRGQYSESGLCVGVILYARLSRTQEFAIQQGEKSNRRMHERVPSPVKSQAVVIPAPKTPLLKQARSLFEQLLSEKTHDEKNDLSLLLTSGKNPLRTWLSCSGLPLSNRGCI